MAGIAGGVDGIDLAVRPLASGTSQPDVRSMAHSLKGTGFSLDIDPSKMDEIESLLNKSLSEYEFNPVTTSADARVVGFPMPGGAIGPNVHMMKSAGILDKYSDVLAEFPEVVRAGGGWTSVTPGSQQYWLQAFNNVLHGRWEKIDAGYGKSVLGYFGRPPLPPDPEVVKIASEKLELPPFDGDPLEEAPDTLTEAENALKERGIEITDENKFLVAAAIVPGKNMELNEGIRLLEKRSKITLPLKKEESGNQKNKFHHNPNKNFCYCH
jgi:pyruvate carboxylase subunit B